MKWIRQPKLAADRSLETTDLVVELAYLRLNSYVKFLQ